MATCVTWLFLQGFAGIGDCGICARGLGSRLRAALPSSVLLLIRKLAAATGDAIRA